MTDPNLSTIETLYHSGAWLCLGIVAVFIALRYASSHIGWLKAPARAHYVTIALAVLAVLVVPATQGATPNMQMILSALGAGLALVMPGPKAA